MDYDLKVSKFKLHSRYYVHFRTNTLLFFYKDDFGTKSTKVDMPLKIQEWSFAAFIKAFWYIKFSIFW